MVFARIGIMMMGTVDAAVVGHQSARQLGYHSIGWAPTSVVLTTAVGLLLGVQVMTARHVGEGRSGAVGGVLRRGLVYGLILGILSVAVIVVAGPPFLHVMGLSRDLADGATQAMLIFAWSLPGYFLATVCMYFLEALKRPIPGMIVMWAANVLNLALDLWLVPGHSGFPVMGAVAAAWATLSSRIFMAAVLLAYIALMPGARALGVFGKPIDGPCKAGRRATTHRLRLRRVHVHRNRRVRRHDPDRGPVGRGLQAAAWATILNVAAMIFMAPLGLSSATAVLVGRAFGARDHDGVSRAGFLGFAATTVLLAIVCVVVGFGARAVAQIYTLDPTLLGMIAPALVLSCLFYIPDGLQVVGAQALRARGDVWLPTFFHLASYAVIMVPLAWKLLARTGRRSGCRASCGR